MGAKLHTNYNTYKIIMTFYPHFLFFFFSREHQGPRQSRDTGNRHNSSNHYQGPR